MMRRCWISFSQTACCPSPNIYGNGGIQNVLNTIVPSDTQEFASYYASMESAEQERLKLINEFFAK